MEKKEPAWEEQSPVASLRREAIIDIPCSKEPIP